MLKHKGTVNLETDNLILRKFKLADLNSTYENWYSDYKVIKPVNLELNETIEDTREMILDLILGYTDNKNYDFAIVEKKSEEVIGSVQLVNIHENLEKCEIGFVLGSKFWNKGYMTEAINKVLEFCFNDVKFVRVEAFCALNNFQSERVLEKVGMQFEGILKKGICIRGDFSDGKLFAITDDYFYMRR